VGKSPEAAKRYALARLKPRSCAAFGTEISAGSASNSATPRLQTVRRVRLGSACEPVPPADCKIRAHAEERIDTYNSRDARVVEQAGRCSEQFDTSHLVAADLLSRHRPDSAGPGREPDVVALQRRPPKWRSGSQCSVQPGFRVERLSISLHQILL